MTNEGFGTNWFYYFPIPYFQTGQPSPIPQCEGIGSGKISNTNSSFVTNLVGNRTIKRRSEDWLSIVRASKSLKQEQRKAQVKKRKAERLDKKFNHITVRIEEENCVAATLQDKKPKKKIKSGSGKYPGYSACDSFIKSPYIKCLGTSKWRLL